MNAPAESRLLRLAISKGLLAWEDLDAVADRLLTPSGDDTPAERLWIEALVNSGRLDADTVARLMAEISEADPALAPTLVEAPPGRAGAVAFPPELRFLKDWSRYGVERFLGSGGMGAVYLASDPQLGRRVALKFLHYNDPVLVVRFLREARAQARVEHPNICQVHEVGEVEGRPYIAMQYIEGKSLSELRGKLSPEASVRLVRDVARAVHTAHKIGLIHRDLKPGNILVGQDDAGGLHPWVVDFGLAQDQGEEGLTRTGLISGTPAYVSPEQAQGAQLDRRTDVYSLGVVLYELLTENPPFVGPSAAGTLVRVLEEEPESLRKRKSSIPADLETIVLKCLEKEAERRYDSARSLADDLDRWLEGDPIQARPASLTYRTGKRLRKHRALAAVAAAAVVLLTVLGAEVLRTRWQARDRAELAQRFGQRVKEMEASLRYAALLPRHDVTATKRRLRSELEKIRKEMDRLGPLAEGPGNYALGQGYLALHQDELAREHLERAWNAGQRTPEVAEALGRVFGSFLEKTLATAVDPEQVRQRYRTPTLTYLKEAARDPEQVSPYLLGLIAYHEDRYPEAVARARQAYRETPWLYEAALLEGRVYIKQAGKASDGDRQEEALRLYDRAGEVYSKLLSIVPSDASLYAADCERRAYRIRTALKGEELGDEPVREALRSCDLALEVDPELSEVHTLKTGIFWAQGDRKQRYGKDPQPDFAAAIAEGKKAIALNPRDARAYNHLSIAYRLLASWRLGRGEDPAEEFRRAVEMGEEAVRLQPELTTNHNSLANACLALAQDQQRRGTDPRPLLRRAVASAGQALELNPEYLPSRITLGNAWNFIAEAEASRGQDPSKSLEAAIAAFQRAANLNPGSASTHNNLGNTYLTLGEYLLARGTDPRQALQKAAASYRQAVTVRPDYAYGPYNLAYTYRLMGEALLDSGEDPVPALASARSYTEASFRINPDDADTFLEQGRIELIAARHALLNRRDPGPALQAADAALARAEELNPSAPDIYLAQAQVERWRADPQSVRRGLERVGKALSINPEDANAFALRGALLHLSSRLETDPVSRREQVARAAESVRKAISINPLLRREYGPLLSQGERP
ncbi:MAG TPA: protein kinase [Thermoanaerobaculia bacterium]|nr:protein kinase [Thermoanaerobaculia bacterium]